MSKKSLTPKSIQAEIEKVIAKAIEDMLKSYCMDGDIIWNNSMLTKESVAKFQAPPIAQSLTTYFLNTAPEMVELDKEKVKYTIKKVVSWATEETLMDTEEVIDEQVKALSQAKVIRVKQGDNPHNLREGEMRKRRKRKIDWGKVWKSFNRWFDYYAKDYTWETQSKKIEELVEQQFI